MKKKIFFLIIVFSSIFLISSTLVYAEEVKVNNNQLNTKLNIKGAKLIEKYLASLSSSLSKVEERYNLKNNRYIKDYTKKLEGMSVSLRSIQNLKITKSSADLVMKNILSELKVLNVDIKKLLKKEKEKHNIKIESDNLIYYKLGSRLSLKLNKIILKLLIPISKKDYITLKDKKTIRHLKELKNESEKLNSLNNLKFKTKSILKKELKIIIKKIKKIFLEMKEGNS